MSYLNIKYNHFGKIENSNVYLCKPNAGRYCALNGIDPTTFSYTQNLQDFDTITFTMNKHIDVNGVLVESNGYSITDYLMEIEVDNIGRFVISEPPTINNDGIQETMTVNAESIDKKLMSRDLTNFCVNVGTMNSIERTIEGNVDPITNTANNYIRFYNPYNKEYSLLDILIDNGYIHGWTVGYVNSSIAETFPAVNEDNTNVYAFLTQTLSSKLHCIFKFDTLKKTINVYNEDEIGDDTEVYVSFRNLQNTLEISPQTSDIYTRFTVTGANDIDISEVNFGESQIVNLDYFLNTNYLPQETITKYKTYEDYREEQRSVYIDLMKNRSVYEKNKQEIMYKVPLDSLSYDWDSFSSDELLEELTHFQGIVNAMLKYSLQEVNDGNDSNNAALERTRERIKTTITSLSPTRRENLRSAFHNYIGGVDEYLKIYFDTEETEENRQNALTKLVNNLSSVCEYADVARAANGTFSWFIRVISFEEFKESIYWYDFKTYTEYIIPNIDIAMKNIGLTQDDKIDYINDWETEWDRYGTEELKNVCMVKYKNIMEVLEKYAPEWSELDQNDEKNKSLMIEGEDIYNTNHNKYLEAKTNYQGAENEYKAKMVMVGTYSTHINKTDNELAKVVKSVKLENFLTEEEINTVKELYYDSDYSNENFYVTSQSTVEKALEEKQRLYDYAVEDLAKQSRPQMNFSTTLDNLLALDEFKHWHNSIAVGNFIRVGTDDVHSEKLRIISITFNPMVYDEKLELDFSSMMKWNNQRNDFTQLFDEANAASKNSISKGSSGSTDSTELSTELINFILKSPLMSNALDCTELSAINAAKGTFGTIIADTINVEIANIKELTAEIINADYIKSNEIVTNLLTADRAEINRLFATDAFVENISSISSTTITNTVNTQFVSNLIAGKIQAVDLFGNNIIIGDTTSGRIIINNATMQFQDKLTNGEYKTYIQLGKDKGGKNSLIIKNDEGNTIIDGNGVTENAIGDELIVSDMLKKRSVDYSGIDLGALNISQMGMIKQGQSYSIKASNVYFNDKNQSLNTVLGHLEKDIYSFMLNIVVVQGEDGSYTFRAEIRDMTKDLTPVVDGDFAYQWYIGERKLEGETKSVLKYKPTSSSDYSEEVSCVVTFDENTINRGEEG